MQKPAPNSRTDATEPFASLVVPVLKARLSNHFWLYCGSWGLAGGTRGSRATRPGDGSPPRTSLPRETSESLLDGATGNGASSHFPVSSAQRAALSLA